MSSKAILQIRDLTVEHKLSGNRKVHAVSGISFDVAAGQTLGLVGESGCGKSSAARALIQLPRPTSGSVALNGVDLTTLSGDELRAERRNIQMIFQDPIASLNPRRPIGDTIGAPLRIARIGTRAEINTRVTELLEQVGLNPEQAMSRRPHEFSGGQCQRISIARAIALQPDVLVCDEPVSALDVSVQAQILNLLHDMQAAHSLTMVFISHDLAVVRNIADHVAVMYLGKLCELAPVQELYARPLHPYTQLLLNAVPRPDPSFKPPPAAKRATELPSPLNPPSGCRFRTRCAKAQAICAEKEPQWAETETKHWIACHFPG